MINIMVRMINLYFSGISESNFALRDPMTTTELLHDIGESPIPDLYESVHH